MAREAGPARRAYRQVMEMMAGIFAANLGPAAAGPAVQADPEEDAQRALAVVALCVGGVVLARAVDDERIADDLRAAARRFAGALAGWEDAER